MEAIVAGGGIGGLAAAAGLLRRGWDVTVLERSPAFTVAGAGISLWPNAFRALDAVGVTLGDDRLRAAIGLRDWRGRWLVRVDGDDAAVGAVIAHRHELRTALLAQVPPERRLTGVRVTGARVEGARAVVEHEGGELSADLLVGADGVHSAVRRSLWPAAAEPRYSKQTAWRLVLPRPPSLSLPWSETWGPGAVFGMFPMPGDRVYCYATATVPAGGQSGDGELAELRRRFAHWCDPIPAVLNAAAEDQVQRNDIHHLPALPTYVRGPVALLGDAAHAMTPNLGQGGCQALEDAATLSTALTTHPDVPTALHRYDEARRPRTQAMSRRALTSRDVSHLRWAPARVARNALVRAIPKPVFVSMLTRPFTWHPEEGLTT